MDLHLAFEGVLGVIGFLTSLWMRGVLSEIKQLHADVKEIARQVSNHGERLAVLESRIDDLRSR